MLAIDTRGDTPLHYLARNFVVECAEHEPLFRLMRDMIAQVSTPIRVLACMACTDVMAHTGRQCQQSEL